MSTRTFFTIVVALGIAVGAWWYAQNSFSHPLLLVTEDSIENWGIPGITVTAESTARAEAEIKKLRALFGNKEEEPTDYAINVGIAQQYERMGDGKKAYEYIGKAISIDSEKTGLGWHNLGALLARLGAYNTARSAYDRAVEVQAHVEQYHVARIEFLIAHFPKDAAALTAAFAEAESQFGNLASIFQLKAAYFAKTGKTEEAIAAWQKVKELIPGGNEAIDAEIVKLRRAL